MGPPWFATLVILQGFLRPEYSHIRMPISTLTAYDTGWIQILNFCVFGSLAVLFALGLHAGVARTRRGVVGAALLVLNGIGIILAGLFPWVMVNGQPAATPQHAAAAVTTFGSAGAGFILFSRRLAADPRWQSFAAYTLLTGVVILALFVTIGLFAIDDAAPLHAWAGLLQRVLCAVWFTCMIVLALRSWRLGRHPAPAN